MDNLSYFISLMPQRICDAFCLLDDSILLLVNEIRFRKNKPLVIYVNKDLYFLTQKGISKSFGPLSIIVSSTEFEELTDLLCNNSYHTNMDSMVKGYITVNDGSRVGIAGKAIYRDNQLTAVRNINSLCIRISHDYKNCSKKIVAELYDKKPVSIIVAGEPKSGKTTFLRDMGRLLSSGFNGKYMCVTFVDEREELSAGNCGINTDSIIGYEKAKGIEIATRTLAPQLIICDEIGNKQELEAIKYGFSTGVNFAVSVHLRDSCQISNNKIVSELINTGEFDYLLLLKSYTKEYEIIDLRLKKSENSRNYNDYPFFIFPWDNDSKV